jgi:phage terminase small subunit
MGRNKTPTAILDAKGSFLKHPDRARPKEPVSDKPLGSAPKWLSKEEKKVWKELAKQALPGVVLESDRMLFALMVRLANKLYTNQEMRVGEMSTLITLGSKFAMNPADRSKVVVEKPAESVLDKFMARRRESPNNDFVQ